MTRDDQRGSPTRRKHRHHSSERATVEVAAKFTFDPQTAGAVGQSDTANFQNIGVHLEQVIG